MAYTKIIQAVWVVFMRASNIYDLQPNQAANFFFKVGAIFLRKWRKEKPRNGLSCK
jgi:hypothetical protein